MNTSPRPLPRPSPAPALLYTGNIIVIGVSTGGPKTLYEIFGSMPTLDAAVIIVQHVPPHFDRAIAERLSTRTGMPVSVAEDRMPIRRGHVYMARGNHHLLLNGNSVLRLEVSEKVHCCRPSVDVTMNSLRRHHGGRLIGVILTGMGYDGAEGIAHIKGLGGLTIAQDEQTSVIFGMPRAAIETGMVDYILPRDGIGRKLAQLAGVI